MARTQRPPRRLALWSATMTALIIFSSHAHAVDIGVPTLSASEAQPRMLRIEWGAPANSATAGLTGYEVATKLCPPAAACGTATIVPLASDVLSYEKTPVHPGTQHSFRVRALSGDGTPGGWMPEVKLTALADAPEPPEPTLSSDDPACCSVRVEWTAPEENGAPIEAYVAHAHDLRIPLEGVPKP